MIDSEQLKQNVVKAVEEIRATNPMAGSITNTVTIDFVANAQLAVGGSAAMVYLPDEGEALVAGGGAIYMRGNGKINISGSAQITGNSSSLDGGAILMGWGTINISGSAKISNNTASRWRHPTPASPGCSIRWAWVSVACAPSW